MEDKTITFTITATSQELEQAIVGRGKPDDVTTEQFVADWCKLKVKELLSENEKIEVTNQKMQEVNDEIKVEQDQVDQKWDGKISVEIK